MSNEPIQIRATPAPWWRGVELLFRQGSSVGVSVVMEENESAVAVEPTVRISDEEAQTLMDDLWNCGFRPTEGTGSAGAMRAVESHVSDLRKIAFKMLEIQE